MVLKKNEDYRSLIAVSVQEKYSLHHTTFHISLNGCRVFTKLDLTRAAFPSPTRSRTQTKLRLLPFELFEFNVVIFGLRNAVQTFQRLIDTALRGLDFCHPYIDILIASPDY